MNDEKEIKAAGKKQGLYTAYGLLIGSGVGILIGIFFSEMGALYGLGIGAPIGLAFGAAFGSNSAKNQ